MNLPCSISSSTCIHKSAISFGPYLTGAVGLTVATPPAGELNELSGDGIEPAFGSSEFALLFLALKVRFLTALPLDGLGDRCGTGEASVLA